MDDDLLPEEAEVHQAPSAELPAESVPASSALPVTPPEETGNSAKLSAAEERRRREFDSLVESWAVRFACIIQCSACICTSGGFMSL